MPSRLALGNAGRSDLCPLAREVPGGLGQIRPERLLAAAIRQNRVERRQDHASDVTPEVAELQEAYNIGTVDWAIIDASGMAEATLRDC